MTLNRKSIISGVLIAYLAVSAIQTLSLCIDKFDGIDFSFALNCSLAVAMGMSAWLILKKRRAGFITAFVCFLTCIVWILIILIKYPVISSVSFWSDLAVYIAALLLTSRYAFERTEPAQIKAHTKPEKTPPVTYEQYLHSNSPMLVSGKLLGVLSLFPIFIFVTEGWHNGILYAIGYAIGLSVFIPGIYLLRPWALYLWAACSTVVVIFGLLLMNHYFRSTPDWMDAKIPHAVMLTIQALLVSIQLAAVTLGLWGWVRYFKLKRARAVHA